jgi:hypothetical protein
MPYLSVRGHLSTFGTKCDNAIADNAKHLAGTHHGTLSVKTCRSSNQPFPKEHIMSTSVYCIALSDLQANSVVTALKETGFRVDDISVLFPNKSTTRDFAHEKNTKAPEGAATGGAAGGIVGGALGWMAGIGLLAIPGVGPFIAAGPIMAALSGAAVGAAVGGITGTLVGLGMPEYEAKRYEGKIRDGGILISVHADNGDWVNRAMIVFKDAGTHDIGSSSDGSSDNKSPVGNPSAKNKTTVIAPAQQAKGTR